MNISKTLKYIYPDLDFEKDIELVDFNGETIIRSWNYNQPQPTVSELSNAEIFAKRLKLAKDISLLTATKIAELFGEEPNTIQLAFVEINKQARFMELSLLTTLSAEETIEQTDLYNKFQAVKNIRANAQTLKTSLLSSDPDTFDLNVGW